MPGESERGGGEAPGGSEEMAAFMHACNGAGFPPKGAAPTAAALATAVFNAMK